MGAQCRLGYEHWDGPSMQVRALAAPHPTPPPTRAALALSRCRHGCTQLSSLQGNSSFSLAVSCTSVGGAGQGLAHAGSTHGWSWETGQSPRQFQSASCPLFQERAGMCTLHKRSLGFLQPSCKPHWISNQPRGVTFPVLDVRDGVPNMWLEPLAPQGGSLNLYNPLLFCDLSCCAGSDPIASFPFLPSPCGYFLQPWL